MHESSKAEKWILKKYITDSKLSTSLALIRAMMESIWGNDAPRIVQNYTDHGEEHCKRVAGFVEKLLLANPSAKFSQQEIYLLLAGVYLHDIGMQCDVVKYNEVKIKAEELKAKFDVKFTAKTANDYSPIEQAEIRNNHHYLSAAWIDYLYEENDPSLSNAIKSVPDYLIDDLIDICKFHSNLSINDCPDSFNHNPNNRKKLISALLRLADELDISSTRINLNTVMIFNLNPDNSVFWWLHNYTEVIFITSNTINLTVRLNPEDFERYNTFISKAYISDFKKKNQPVLDVLVGQKIPIVISDKSEVVSDRRVKKFPLEITAVLDKKKEISGRYDISKNFTSSANEKIEDSNFLENFRHPEIPKTLTNPLTGPRTKNENFPRAVIFSALSVKYNAVRDHLKCLEEDKHPQGTIYERGIFSYNNRSLKNTEADKPSGEIDIPKIYTSPSTGMEFVLILAGKFVMGSPDSEVSRFDSEDPIHEVTIKNSYYIGKYPITQKHWEKVMGNNPSRFKNEDRPVEYVSWDEVQEFIKKLNEKEFTGKYRLPLEAEWEYACRADTQTRFYFGDDESELKEYAWYTENSDIKTHPVGQKKPNQWGLYDMHGNVWEWVQDRWHDNYQGAPNDGNAWEDIFSRVSRGGGWRDGAGSCRSAVRYDRAPSNRVPRLGFRILREI